MTPAEAFAHHQVNCLRCAGVRLDRPATLAYACLEGSRLAKLAANPPTEKPRRRDAHGRAP